MPASLDPGSYYHVYNRAVGGEDLFREPRNYAFFLERYAHHVAPAVGTLAYCLMPNHFHLVIRVREVEDEGGRAEDALIRKPVRSPRPDRFGSRASPTLSRRFANLFASYAKAVNKAWDRSGALFERPFRRIRVDDARYLATLIRYVHRNPVHHGFVADLADWPHSSYHALLDRRPTRLDRPAVLDHFGGSDAFRSVQAEPIRWMEPDLTLE